MSVDFSKASVKDNFEEIALCIYETDPYIYPAAFGNDASVASNAISRLINDKDGLFDLNNIIVAKYNSHVIGVCLVYDKPTIWHTSEYFDRIKDILPPDHEFEYTSKNYFETVTSDIEDGAYIMSFCIEKSFRGRGVSNKFMRYVINQYQGKDIYLDVLSNNISAIKMYEKMGFVKSKEKEGFDKETVLKKPMCDAMIRKADE